MLKQRKAKLKEKREEKKTQERLYRQGAFKNLLPGL